VVARQHVRRVAYWDMRFWNNDLKLPQDRLDLLELGIMIIPKQDRKNAFKSCGDYTNVVTQIIN
jgi:hypothetical protein